MKSYKYTGVIGSADNIAGINERTAQVRGEFECAPSSGGRVVNCRSGTMKSRLRSIFVMSLALVAGVLLLRKKRSAVSANSTSTERDVEDFTPIQEAVLQRVREIQAEECTK